MAWERTHLAAADDSEVAGGGPVGELGVSLGGLEVPLEEVTLGFSVVQCGRHA